MKEWIRPEVWELDTKSTECGKVTYTSCDWRKKCYDPPKSSSSIIGAIVKLLKMFFRW